MKREAGENPAQGRYCIRREVPANCHCDHSRGKAARKSLSAVSQKTCLSQVLFGASDPGHRQAGMFFRPSRGFCPSVIGHSAGTHPSVPTRGVDLCSQFLRLFAVNNSVFLNRGIIRFVRQAKNADRRHLNLKFVFNHHYIITVENSNAFQQFDALD
jgi:hypothetical protein